MRAWILSDLHLESGGIQLPPVESDLVILAGDIFSGRTARKSIDWVLKTFAKQPVLIIAGNHEFYHGSIEKTFELLHEKFDGSNVHLLENSSFSMNGWTFLGATLWTDFQGRALVMRNAEALMQDFRLIEFEGRLLRAEDTVQLHNASIDFLTQALASNDPARTFVISHHAPSSWSEAQEHKGGLLSEAFCSDLEELIQRYRPAYWQHGHTHYNADYTPGLSRVSSNQRGYRHQPSVGFNSGFVIDLPDFEIPSARPSVPQED